MQKTPSSLHPIKGLKQRRLFVGLFAGLLFWWAWSGMEQPVLAFDLGSVKSWFNRLAGQKPSVPHEGMQAPGHASSRLPNSSHAVGPMRFGESMRLYGCLVVSVKGVLDRRGALQRIDWVHMQVENRCKQPVLRKGAILVLYENGGGRRILPFWLLEGKQRLAPGEKQRLRLPSLDIKNAKPVAWLVMPARQRHNVARGYGQIPAALDEQRQNRSFSSYGETPLGAYSRLRVRSQKQRNGREAKKQRRPRVSAGTGQQKRADGRKTGITHTPRSGDTGSKNIFTQPPALP